MTPEALAELLRFERAWQEWVRQRWLRLLDIAVFGDLASSKLGALGKVRKRSLDLGEKWRSLFNDKSWIPQPREQLKNALGSAASLRDSLLLLEKAAKDVEGGADYLEFERLLIELHEAVVGELRERENLWAHALDEINRATGASASSDDHGGD